MTEFLAVIEFYMKQQAESDSNLEHTEAVDASVMADVIRWVSEYAAIFETIGIKIDVVKVKKLLKDQIASDIAKSGYFSTNLRTFMGILGTKSYDEYTSLIVL